MNSWLYLTAKGFAHSVEIDYDNAPVFVWHDAQSPTETSLSEAAAGLKGRSVALVLPMEMCSWVLTEPWPGKRRPTAQALAFAVEDQLADDLDELHFAVGPVDTQQRYPLLITHKQRFRTLLCQLHERGLTIVSAQVDADLLPRDQACMQWWCGRWLVGGTLEFRLAVSLVGLELVKSGLPTALTARKIDWDALPEDAINLLQGEFRRQVRGWPWRRLRVMALLMFTLALGFTHLRSSFLEGEAARIYVMSEERFKTLYPAQTRIVDLSAQLKAMQQRATGAQGGHMARLLQLTEQVIGASSVEVQHMEWRASIGWVLNLTVGSFAQLEQLRERGVQSALPITLGNASQQGSRVQAMLTLRDES
ncbi:MAG: hypothetical protein J6D44_01915 [Pseudomonas sp.]|nr:hypothetical protein [Pseudomonas sp.]